MTDEELAAAAPREESRTKARDRKRATPMVVVGASVKKLVRSATRLEDAKKSKKGQKEK